MHKIKKASNVKDISFMFYKCSSLITLKAQTPRSVEHNSTFDFKFDKVKDMSFMFYKCENLNIEEIEKELNTKLFIADKTCMFEGCKSMKKYNTCFII